MKALRFDKSGLQIADIARPRARGEVLVRVTLSGICNTDLEIIRGYAAFEGTIGHEFVGVVEEGDSDLAGERVVGEINTGCGRCKRCSSGDPRHCPARTVLGIVGRDGAHAEYISLPSANLVRVPNNVTDEAAVFAEPLAAAYGIMEQVDIRNETRVGVIGDGKLGLLCAMSLALKSNNVTLIGKHREKLAIAAKRGVETVLLSDIEQESNRPFDVVVEASGAGSGFSTALHLVRPQGKIVLKSTFRGTSTWEASRIVVDEITIVGSRCGRLGPAVELLASGAVDPRDLISKTFPLSDGVKAMRRAGEKGVLKVLLRP